MISSIDVAKGILDKGYNVVPLFPNSKETDHKNWQNRKYKVDDFLKDSNIGINLGLSGLIDVDLDCDASIHFGNKYLPHDTLMLKRIRPNGKYKISQITHFFFQNNGILKDNDVKKFRGETILEYRCNGQTVVYGPTPYKGDPNIMVQREWVNDSKPKFVQDLQQIINKIYFAVAICTYNVGANQGALKLDSCIMRYTNWSDSERENFIYDICEITDPKSKDFTRKKMERIVKSNNKETKNSGYQSFAQHVGADAKEMKNLFKLIGSVPTSDDYEPVKSIVDFNSKALNMLELRNTEIPPLINAVDPIMPEGFGAIAGRPKAMKSFTMLYLAYCVQNGKPFMGHNVTKGDVIYFALEDSKRRMKDREKKIGVDTWTPPQILLQNDIPYLGFGFEECLENWIASKENPRLVIIDTLARLKPKQGRQSGTAYDLDNQLLGKIQTLAVKNNLTIAFVTHLSKATQDYSWDRIQGSVGIQGMTDFMWLIDRGDSSNNASIVGRGRDMSDFEYAVKWNEEQWQYQFEGNLQMVKMNDNRKEVVDAMKILSKKDKEIAPRDVCKFYGVTVTSKDGKRIARTIQRMEKDFEIIKGEKYGTYRLTADVRSGEDIC